MADDSNVIITKSSHALENHLRCFIIEDPFSTDQKKYFQIFY